MNGSQETSFPVTDLAFDKDRKPWGKPNDVTSLLMLAQNCSIIFLTKGADGKPAVEYHREVAIEPIIHDEGRGIGE